MLNRQTLLQQLAAYTAQLSQQEGVHATPVPGVNLTRISQPQQAGKRRWRACLAVVVQGSKEITVGQDVYCGEVSDYTFTPVDLPVISRVIDVTPHQPFLALLIDLEPDILSEVAAQIKTEPLIITAPQRAMFVGHASEELLDSIVRMARLFIEPEHAPFLGPLAIKEVLYRLLQGSDGAMIRQLIRAGGKTQAILEAMHRIKSELSEDLNVAELAFQANMSRSAFFKHFNQITSQSPIQYQKRLRLHEARRLMLEEDIGAGSSAYKVGYKSVSQFSREYTRMFGATPSQEMMAYKLQATAHIA